ncbi:CD209 antigen-like protein C [Carassius carassius]|uniref:CD209 antigen-like protein C n=1 Tax=Carassius carassius TaxID=217509 RepID=UPI002869460E|nr:CD209 antigen-like protein C [Carassius carassius]
MHRENGQRADDVYINIDTVNGQSGKEIADCNTTRIQSSGLPGSDCVKMLSFRAAEVCLLLLCVLLLTAILVLCVLFTRERQLPNNSNFTEDRDQLLTKMIDLIQLNVQLVQEKHELTKFFQDGWTYYQFSLYYVSTEMKNWTESRRYCTERGADLVIINNSQKQDFVKKISCGAQTWIGLTDDDVNGTWTWVDGSTLTSGFWRPDEPNGHLRENCTVTHSSGWADYSCTILFKWICEKKHFK